MKRVVIVSGYFNPLHIGHINLFRGAKELGDVLVAIINNDKQVGLKGSREFMPENERVEIIKALKYADKVMLAIDDDGSVCKSLEAVAKEYSESELFFAKGGDRNSDNIPEKEVCKKLEIKIVDGVGGGKVQSSSWLLSKINNGNI